MRLADFRRDLSTKRARSARGACALSLLAACALTLLLGVPAGHTQNKTRPRRTSPTADSAKTSRTSDAAELSGLNSQAKAPGAAGAQNQQAGVQARPQAAGDPRPDDDEIDEDEVVRINSSEVLLPVTVRDGSGALVKNLGREDFKVFEDGREQPLSGLSLRQVPVDVALLVDSSSSVAESFEDFRRAAEEFAGRVGAEDRFCLVKFDDRVELLLDWTKSRLQLRRALNRLTTGVFTRFNDALLLAARDQFQRGERRRALVFLSDGIDSNRGSSTTEAALRALLETQVTVYGIANTEIERARKRSELDGLLGAPESSVRFNQLRIGDLREGLRVLDASEQNLAALTRATGGRLYRPRSFRSLERVYAEIADELRHQYALYYTPTNAARDGRFRRVRVEVGGRGYEVSTRVGYYAPRR